MTAVILDHLWQSSVVTLLIGALTLLFRNNSAAVRHGLWFAASVKFLFPFSLLTLLGRALFTHQVADSSIKLVGSIKSVAVPFAVRAPILFRPAPHQFSWTLIAVAIWALGFTAIVALWLVRVGSTCKDCAVGKACATEYAGSCSGLQQNAWSLAWSASLDPSSYFPT